MLAQTQNKVTIVGLVNSVETREGTTKDGREYISGTCSVDTGKDCIVPVNFFSMKMKKDGTPNGIYTGLKTFIDTVQTVANVGREDAHEVELRGASLSENMFSTDGIRVIDTWRVNNSFFRRSTAKLNEEKDYASQFTLSGIIRGTKDEIKNDIPTGRLILSLGTIGYNDSYEVFEIICESPEAVSFMKVNAIPGKQIIISGNIVYKEDTEIVTKKMALGPDIEEVKKKTTRELVLVAADTPVDAQYSDEQITELESKREASKNEVLARAKANQKPKTATGANSPAKKFSL